MKRTAAILALSALVCAAGGAPPASAQSPERKPMTLDDVAALREVSDPRISPEGDWVAYVVRSSDLEADRRAGDLWMSRWDGTRSLQLTFSKEDEQAPRWSPDGRYLAFLSDRGAGDEIDQVWLMDRAGGEAQRITQAKGDVVDYVWSPDSRRLALVIEDPDPAKAEEPGADAAKGGAKPGAKTPKPIVIDRLQFKQDEVGYLGTRRQHLYLLDLATRATTPLTTGGWNEYLPAWSPDGSSLAFVSKRSADIDRDENFDLFVVEAKAGAAPRQITTWTGADGNPDWESRPAWSPDGRLIAYPRGGPPELIEYAVHQLAVVPAAGGAEKLMTPDLDRNVSAPRWSADGAFIYFLVEDDRATHLARIPAGGGKVERASPAPRHVDDYDLGPGGRVALLSGTSQRPAEILALEGMGPRALTDQNGALMARLKTAVVEETSFRSKDGTEIHGFVAHPPDIPRGAMAPALLRIHGGPQWQFYREFSAENQVLAAAGYLVVTANPRGSTGRGEAFSKAIYADWGNKDAQDVLAAVDDAVARGMADPGRLGIGGWSYGGILTNYVLAQDQRFKAATSGASISNILAGYGTDHYIRDYEYELGRPWEHPEVWMRISFPFLHADRITTPTLFLCGEKDMNVPLLNSEQMYQALRSRGIDTQLVIYPGQYHGIHKPGYVRDRLQRYLDWYAKHIPPKPAL